MYIPQFIRAEHSEMSMLQVLEVKERTATPALVKVMPFSAIESANAAVDNAISQQLKGSGSRKRIKYIIYSLSVDSGEILFCTNTTFTKICYMVF